MYFGFALLCTLPGVFRTRCTNIKGKHKENARDAITAVVEHLQPLLSFDPGYNLFQSTYNGNLHAFIILLPDIFANSILDTKPTLNVYGDDDTSYQTKVDSAEAEAKKVRIDTGINWANIYLPDSCVMTIETVSMATKAKMADAALFMTECVQQSDRTTEALTAKYRIAFEILPGFTPAALTNCIVIPLPDGNEVKFIPSKEFCEHHQVHRDCLRSLSEFTQNQCVCSKRPTQPKISREDKKRARDDFMARAKKRREQADPFA